MRKIASNLGEKELMIKQEEDFRRRFSQSNLEPPLEQVHVPLSNDEIAEFERQRKAFLKYFLIVFIVLTAIDGFIFSGMGENRIYGIAFPLMTLVFGMYFHATYAKAIREGKEIIKGVITKRRTDAGGNRNRGRYYYFTLSEKTDVEVREDDYWTFTLGDKVETEIMKRTFKINNKIRLREK